MLSSKFAEMTTSASFRDLLRAANLINVTNEFTSPKKEGRAEDFFRPENSEGFGWVLRY
jgi:hypothetical protein